jgi:hypothetical protein
MENSHGWAFVLNGKVGLEVVGTGPQ